MSTSLGRKVANSAVALSLVFGLAACGETPLDLQRKPELVDLLVDRAVATCVMQKSELDQAPYQSRLKDVLMETKSTTLDFMKSNGITICLDKRLEKQEKAFFGDYKANGVYYPEQKILTLWDNGKSVHQKSWYEQTAVSSGPTFLNKFAEKTFGGYWSDYSSLEAVKNPLLAHKYRCCGKNATTRYEWEAQSSPTAKTLGYNPYLQNPPVLGV